MLAPPQYCYSIIMLINWNYCYPSNHNQTRTIGALVARFYVLVELMDSLWRIGNFWILTRWSFSWWVDCCYDKGYQSKLSSTSINLTREGVLNMWWSMISMSMMSISMMSMMNINLTREGVLNMWWMRGSGWSRLALLIIQILIGNAHNRVTFLQSQCILEILETYAEGSYIWGFPLMPASMPSGP